ncbi:unnamed protein product [Plutella xylostella]|uniref:(diamondback moth) hypothetical protein n=1 Tax=Plutella xylostella TaxID=51655 RepID=A0A8S4DFZ5_PLUXY|nr:unnamed protein product [Plutella xylostella]
MAIVVATEMEVERIILGLRNSSAVGCDGISTTVLKHARRSLLTPLTHIFNNCLLTVIFPECFKRALVHPIYKSGDRDSVTRKQVLEKLLNSRLVNFLDKHKIISDRQFGFRRGLSTEDAVLTVTNEIVNKLDSGKKCVGIFLDLSKAFDTVSVPILLSKLENIGVRGLALDIFRSYLSNRSQRVKIEQHISEDECLSFGVPQGSVLGPTLFLIYINGLCNLPLSFSKIVTYADDTAVIVHGDDWPETQSRAEAALDEIGKWLRNNLLTLNPSKSTYITFAHRVSSQPSSDEFSMAVHSCDRPAGICGCPHLVRVPFTKYLGVILDSSLNWHQHISTLVSRVRKLIYIFRRLRDVANPEILKTVYLSLAQSILSYCIPAWGGADKTAMLRLERAQRAVLKMAGSGRSAWGENGTTAAAGDDCKPSLPQDYRDYNCLQWHLEPTVRSVYSVCPLDGVATAAAGDDCKPSLPQDYRDYNCLQWHLEPTVRSVYSVCPLDGGTTAAAGDDCKPSLPQDYRDYNCLQWHLEPTVRLLSWGGKSIEPYGVDYILQKLGFSHARTTIPKWLQRGTLDPLDKLLSLVLLRLVAIVPHK